MKKKYQDSAANVAGYTNIVKIFTDNFQLDLRTTKYQEKVQKLLT